MKKLFLFLVLVLAGCAGGWKLDGIGTLQHLETTTPSSPCPDLDLSAVPESKMRLVREMSDLIGDPALSESDRAELRKCLCEFLETLTR